MAKMAPSGNAHADASPLAKVAKAPSPLESAPKTTAIELTPNRRIQSPRSTGTGQA
jgi:hypothetical protein